MKQPKGFVMKGKKEMGCKLKKSLYGLNQSPRMWYQKFDTYILGLGFVRSRVDHCVYSKQVGVKMVFGYLCGTTNYGLCYQGRPGLDRVVDIHGFVDADWAGYMDHRRSTSGYAFNLFGGAFNWMRKRQVVVALSTTEVEYMVATHVSKEAIWLQRLCLGIGLVQRKQQVDPWMQRKQQVGECWVCVIFFS